MRRQFFWLLFVAVCFLGANVWRTRRWLDAVDTVASRDRDLTPEAILPLQCHVPPNNITGGRCAPGFIIIGAFKSGTTSMYAYLAQHPQVSLRARLDDEDEDDDEARAQKNVVRFKETNFFNALARRDLTSGARRDAVVNYMERYLVPAYPGSRHMTGEASPAYFFDPAVPGVLYETFPSVKLIALVREPVARAFSRVAHAARLHCAKHPQQTAAMECQRDGVRRMFDELARTELERLKECWRLTAEPSRRTYYYNLGNGNDIWAAMEHNATFWPDLVSCLQRKLAQMQAQRLARSGRELPFRRFAQNLRTVSYSLYFLQVYHWLRWFPRSQLLIVRSEDFWQHPHHVMDRVASHLGLPSMDWRPIVQNQYNVEVNPKTGVVGFVKSASQSNKTTPRDTVTTSTRILLERFFDPFNVALARLMHVDQPLWLY